MGLKLLSLVSGGKDSIMSVMIAVAQGHDVVVLGHLTNAHSGEETDSYMYQSVGSNLVQEALAPALGLPIITRIIKGKSVVTDADYHVDDQDEVEDLFLLLKNAKDEYGIQGITTGAILSSYQRVRVEHVCNRLGLVSLAYCWQVDQTVLLDLMIHVGLEAILVKVAAMGLSPEHLRQTLGEMKDKLSVLHRLYDVHVAGEGGEYETLTLDCPLFRKRIVINRCETVLHSNDAFAPVAYLKILDWELVDKQDIALDLKQRMSQKLILDINSTLTNRDYDLEYVDPSSMMDAENHPYIFILGVSLNRLEEYGSFSIEDEIRMVMEDLRCKLENNGLSFESVALAHVYVTDMTYFAEMNQIYSSYFGINPPARVTVEADLPGKINVQVDLIATKCSRDTLHVQSISFWAAANIGPYAQANAIGNIVFIAGQIGLIPHTMELPSMLNDQINASLHNLQAINMEMKAFPLAAVCYITDPQTYSEVYSAWNNRSVLLTVSCSGLPRSALVEWQTIGLKNILFNDMKIEEIDSDNDNQCIWKIMSASAGNIRAAIGTFSCENQDDLSNGLSKFAKLLYELGCNIVRGFYTPKVDLEKVSCAFKGMNITWIPVSWIEGDSQLGIISYDLQ